MFLDPQTHNRLAQRVIEGLGIGERAFFRAPLYIYLVSVFYKIFGVENFWSIRLFQAIIGSFSALIVSILGTRLINRSAGFLVGIFYGCFWLNIYFDGELLLESFFVFLTLCILLILYSAEELSLRKFFAVGLLLGLSGITRPNILLFGLGIIVLLFFENRIKFAFALSIGLVLMMMPVTLRNLIVARDFVVISSQAGINFWIGNNSVADGRTVVLPKLRKDLDSSCVARYKDDPWFFEDVWLVSVCEAERGEGRVLAESEVSSFWFKKSINWIFDEPEKALCLFLKKSYFLFDRTEVSNNRDLDYHRRHIALLNFLSHYHWGWISPLALLGFFLSLFQFRRWKYIIFYFFLYALSVVAFFINSRYRLPLFPAMVIFAFFAVFRMREYKLKREWKKLGFSFSLFLICFYLFNVPQIKWNDRPLRAAMLYNMGLALIEKGDYERAKEALLSSISIKFEQPDAHLALANVLSSEGNYDDAIEHYKKALLIAPDYALVHYNLGLTLIKAGRQELGYEHLLKAHILSPQIFPEPK